MPRPRKWRKVCCLPDSNRFGPLDSPADAVNTVNMTVDEYETIRLIDLDRFTQEECANQMNISRTTVQGIYDEARKKLAESLVNGKVLWIEGGEYQLCDGSGSGNGCGRGGCRRHRCGRGFTEEPEIENNLNEIRTEDSNENSNTSR
ncbi:MAG TPA: DUF134 domain-containing protein [Cyclobacteriaceae bacterium]|nr:DUF134 domain-containing protein [Cyclobacteriaceae bacterium]